ncbi:MAG: S-layer homology domain-containing protein, partial [Anaerovorax sp.]
KADAYSDYTAKATRTNLAQIFYAAIPANQFKAINKIEALPDVTEKTEGAAAILSLYKAGVLTGSDEYGTFNPTTNIKRSEAAAIITRVAVPTERKLITLKTKESTTPAAITFLSKDKLFEVTVPATWKEKTTYGSINSSLELNSANETVVYISSLSKKKDQPTDYNLTKFIAEYTPSLSKSFTKPEISTT